MITTDGYRGKSSDTIIFMCIIEKVTAIGRVTAIGYRPAIGCDIYIDFFVFDFGGFPQKNWNSSSRFVAQTMCNQN